MNTNELYEILWNDKTASSYVMAIIPSRALSYVKADGRERCYIVNCNENSYLRGEVGHWMILTIHGNSREKRKLKSEDSSLLEVFDSLGERTYNEEITAFMSTFKSHITCSGYLASTHCGFYALAYAYYRSRQYEPSCILKMFKEITDVKSHCLMLYSQGKLI